MSNRRLLILAAMVALILIGWQHFGHNPSEASRVTALILAQHHNAICAKVGVMAFAGARSNLYGCTWPGVTDAAGMPLSTVRRCEVWANGSGYDVTKTARLVFKAQGQPAPC